MNKKFVTCLACLTTGKAKKGNKGHFLIEVALWLCFIIPGMIYTLWRILSPTKSCRLCGSLNIVPSDSAKGISIQKETQNE